MKIYIMSDDDLRLTFIDLKSGQEIVLSQDDKGQIWCNFKGNFFRILQDIKPLKHQLSV